MNALPVMKIVSIPDEDINQIKAVIQDNPRLQLFLKIALGTGLRLREICSLNIEDLLTPEGEIKDIIKVKIKGGRVVDTCLSDNVKQAIKEYIQSQELKSGALFISKRTGKRITPNGMWRDFRNAQIKAGIKQPYHPHQLRHTFGTKIASLSGQNPYLVAELMHHRSLNTAMIYIHLSEQQKFDTLNKVGETI